MIPDVPLPSFPKLDLLPIAINPSVPSPCIVTCPAEPELNLIALSPDDTCKLPLFALNSNDVVFISTPPSKIK